MKKLCRSGEGKSSNYLRFFLLHNNFCIRVIFYLYISEILFLSKGWKENWGGEICFYNKNKKNNKIPGDLSTKIYPKFNRAVFFDVSNHSWHGVLQPKRKVIRNSMAVYYLINPSKKDLLNRSRALYAPTNKQKGNKKILKFIKLRSSTKHFSKVYRKNK